MKKLFLLGLISFSLISCKKELNVSNDFTYSHKFVERDFLPIVEGTLNGKKAYFLLDTGASLSILNLKKSSEYGVRIGNTEDVGIGGYGGVTSDITELTNVDLRFGTERMKDKFSGKDIGYLIKAIRKNTGFEIVGIVGNNNITTSKLILDFENNVILKR